MWAYHKVSNTVGGGDANLAEHCGHQSNTLHQSASEGRGEGVVATRDKINVSSTCPHDKKNQVYFVGSILCVSFVGPAEPHQSTGGSTDQTKLAHESVTDLIPAWQTVCPWERAKR